VDDKEFIVLQAQEGLLPATNSPCPWGQAQSTNIKFSRTAMLLDARKVGNLEVSPQVSSLKTPIRLTEKSLCFYVVATSVFLQHQKFQT